MRVSTEVIYDMLAEKYQLKRYGRTAKERELLLPVFYNPQTQTRKGAIYVARTEDLVRKPMEDCLFFCVGPKPPSKWSMWPCEIIHVENANKDLLTVFNTLQRIFGRLLDWHGQMQELAAGGSDVRSMVEASIPLFGNRITVTDYDLNVLAYCELVETDDDSDIEMSDRYIRVPSELIGQQGTAVRRKSTSRKPFFVQEEGRPDSYCVNLYMGNDYIGCCALQEELRPLRKGDLELFEMFADFVRLALGTQAHVPGGQLVTMRTVFEQLLRRYPVSRQDVSRAFDLVDFNLPGITLENCRWRCIVIRSADGLHAYPERYLCATVEDLFGQATAFAHDSVIAVFCALPPDEDFGRQLPALDRYLFDMNYIAGVSRSFGNVLQAHEYYRQATAALDLSFPGKADVRYSLFDDQALGFMLDRCCGDFEPQLVIDPALVQVAKLSASGVDYVDTLRNYLDNNCNASRTAQVMFLHRSTLVQRMEHIEQLVDLSSARNRLYLQMCLHLPGIDDVLKGL